MVPARRLGLLGLVLPSLGGSCTSIHHPPPEAATRSAVPRTVVVAGSGGIHADSATIARLVASAVELTTVSDSAGARLDLSAIGQAIGESRVVMLGEPWHGDGGAIGLRTQIVQYLHQHHGFDVLIFEADFYSIERGWARARRDGNIADFAAANIYPFWSSVPAAQPLWKYIAQRAATDRPLDVAGLDPRHVGDVAQASLVPELQSYLATTPGMGDSDRAEFRAMLQRLLKEEWDYKPSASDRQRFLMTLDRLEVHLNTATPDSGFIAQEVRNLRNAALYAWAGASRDRAMGENFAWLATKRFPNRKIIVWAHNNHILGDKWTYLASEDADARRFVARLSREQIGRWTYLGEEIKRYFGDDAYGLAVLSHSGNYTPNISPALRRRPARLDSTTVLAPSPVGTLEAALAAQHRTAFIDLRPHRGMTGPVPTRVLDYSSMGPVPLTLSRGWDGLIFLRTTVGLHEFPFRPDSISRSGR